MTFDSRHYDTLAGSRASRMAATSEALSVYKNKTSSHQNHRITYVALECDITGLGVNQ